MPSADAAPKADSRRLRDALGQFATGVTVVTARGADGELAGITVNSFTSVSLEPPLILWCLGRAAATARAFTTASHFAVNVLHADQEHLARLFAARRADKFEHVAGIEAGAGGAPLLPGCVARLQCATHDIHAGGDHHILVGEVIEVEQTPGQALLFHQGRFARTSGDSR